MPDLVPPIFTFIAKNEISENLDHKSLVFNCVRTAKFETFTLILNANLRGIVHLMNCHISLDPRMNSLPSRRNIFFKFKRRGSSIYDRK